MIPASSTPAIKTSDAFDQVRITMPDPLLSLARKFVR